MNQKDTPDWIKNLDLSKKPEPEAPFVAEVDADILYALQKLSLDELDELANISGVREHQGILTSLDEWSREEYIEALSNIGEMHEPQIQRIKNHLGIK